MVDSIILSMAEPRSEEVEAVESDTIIPPSDTALECTRTCGDSDTKTDWVTVDTLETLVDCATEEESGRWTPRTSVLELVSGIKTYDNNRSVSMRNTCLEQRKPSCKLPKDLTNNIFSIKLTIFPTKRPSEL